MINMNEYKLTTTRGADGDYLTDLTYNGQKVDFEIPLCLRGVLGNVGVGNIKTLADNKEVDRLEFIISGEDLT